MELHLTSDKWVECCKCGHWLWDCYCSQISNLIDDGPPVVHVCPSCWDKDDNEIVKIVDIPNNDEGLHDD